jgi:hypothetical protein
MQSSQSDGAAGVVTGTLDDTSETPDQVPAEPSQQSSPLLPSVPPAYIVPLAPRDPNKRTLSFRQGSHAPYGIRWYGVTSLYGHFRGFIARAVAAESVDSRDWMRPESPGATLEQAIAVLGGKPGAPTLVESLGRPLYIDFVADTGDDRDVSLAVGKMIAATYTLTGPDGDMRLLPRGDTILFGGDIAYPVATADEIYRRLVEPWNIAFRAVRHQERKHKRLMLAVPGNHDWYDGLDGFGRLFRKSVAMQSNRNDPVSAGLFATQLRKLQAPFRRAAELPGVGRAIRELHLDEVGGLFRMVGSVSRSVTALSKGGGKKRRRRLQLHGYTPIQEASYFVLPLARNLDLWGVDRQLSRMDFRQRQFFRDQRAANPDRGLVFLASDPAMAYGLPSAAGQGLLSSCRLRPSHDKFLYITGDFHHYERRAMGISTHVIAGGGGAFLHGTRVAPHEHGEPDAEYPPQEASRRLLAQVPWRFVVGRGGYLIHVTAALLCIVELTLLRAGPVPYLIATALATTGIVLGLHAIAGFKKKKALALSLLFGTVAGIGPVPFALTLPRFMPALASLPVIVTLYAFLAAFVYGWFLVFAHRLGLEHDQAFTALGHPGFKHFVRLCVHADGRVEGFVIGKDDPLGPEPAALIDRFEWQAPEPAPKSVAPPKHTAAP